MGDGTGEPGSVDAGGRVCVGVVVAAQGIRGEVRVKSFTQDPAMVGAYGPLADETGARRFTVKAVRPTKHGVVLRLAEVTDRNQAEALRGLGLYVDRAVLPALEEEEFYHGDLIGLAAETVTGEPLGVVRAVFDFGAGDVLEIQPAAGAALMVPFTRKVVPVVDVARGRLVVDPPEGLSGPNPPEDGGPEDGGPEDGWPEDGQPERAPDGTEPGDGGPGHGG